MIFEHRTVLYIPVRILIWCVRILARCMVACARKGRKQ